MRGKCNGAKRNTEAAGCVLRDAAVEEHSIQDRSMTVRTCGPYGSDHAGISNDKEGENPSRRKSKGSRARRIRPGLVGP